MPLVAPSRPWPVKVSLAVGLLLGCAAASAVADVVILKDGFLIQGNVRKEMDTVRDPIAGNVRIPKGNGFDFIDEGPKFTIFSSHHKQLGEINKDIKLRPDYKAYTNPILSRKGNTPLPAMYGSRTAPRDFDAKWKRTLVVNVATSRGNRGFENIDQQITYLDPYCCYVVSGSHFWRQGFRTSEMDPVKVRKLLSTHPELAEPDGKCIPIRRIAIARFLKDVGWLQMARDEIALLKKDHPAPLTKEDQELLDRFTEELERAAAELMVNEAELALHAGRYKYAGELLDAVPVKAADPKDVLRVTQMMAQHKTAMEQFQHGRRLLRTVIDEATGQRAAVAAIAAGSGLVAQRWPLPFKPPASIVALASAAEAVYAELHPDSAGRIEFFVNLAQQVEREHAQGKPASKSHEELLATAISGWVKGKNGASPLPEVARKLWEARELVLKYQRTADMSTRKGVVANYRKTTAMGIDELAQIISLLPPAEAENLRARTGTLLSEKVAPPGTYRRRSAGTREHPTGMDYLIKLPPEYHHGRAYPVLIALTTPSMDPEAMMRALANETDRRGYILVAPEWAGQFDKGWQWKGEDHDDVTGVLRDVIRHFTVDNDKVFLFGAGDGGNMALDVGVSHPDLFAGVVAMGAAPKWQGMFIEYWRNAQNLPVYIVTGELVGDPAAVNLRRIYQNWMPNGFPALEVMYKGRGAEWYPAEVPVIFDWLGRKKRPHGTATLQLGANRQAWRTMRETDNRFFWLGVDQIDPAHMVDPANPGKSVYPAEIQGDIRGSNSIVVRTRAIRGLTIWLGREMIDWTKPIQVQLNGELKMRPKVLEPDIGVLLEDYRDRGDRRMLFLAKLEFESRN